MWRGRFVEFYKLEEEWSGWEVRGVRDEPGSFGKYVYIDNRGRGRENLGFCEGKIRRDFSFERGRNFCLSFIGK